ncbi:hypothetical protein D3C80_1749400 [compost metagenome]
MDAGGEEEGEGGVLNVHGGALSMVASSIHISRDEMLRCLGDASSYVASSLMDVANDLSVRRVGQHIDFSGQVAQATRLER